RLRHTGMLTGVTFSSDGKWLATAADDGIACVWDAATGKQRHRFTSHSSTIHTIAFAPDGNTLFAFGEQLDRVFWPRAFDLITGKVRPVPLPDQSVGPTSGAVFALALAPNGGLFGYGGGEKFRVYDAASGKLRQLLPQPRGQASPAFAPGGKAVALALDNHTIKVFDVDTGKQLLATDEGKLDIRTMA